MISRAGVSVCALILLLVVSAVPSYADTTVGGRIAADTTWTLAGSPYLVTSTVQVYGTTTAPVTLTIEPGVIVKFNANIGLQIGYSTNQGALIAQGTEAARITFTRSNTSGTWAGITFYDGALDGTVAGGTVLDFTDIQYSANMTLSSASPLIKNSTITNMSGYVSLSTSNSVFENVAITSGSSTYGLYLVSSNPTLTGVTITANATYGILLSASSPVITGGSLTNTNAAGHGIYGNGSPVISNYTVTIVNTAGKYGAYVSSATSALSITNSTIGNGLYLATTNITPTITGNTFTNSDSSPLHAGANVISNILNNNTFSGMTSAGKIEVTGEQVKQNTQWKKWPAAFTIMGNVSVYKDTTTPVTLTIEPGAILKFNTGTGLQIGNSIYRGVLIAQGTAGSKIRFTSGQASPAPGNWMGITFSGAAASASVIENAVIEYAGYGGYFNNANIAMTSSSPRILKSSVTNSAGSGIYLSSANASPAITDCTITGNKWGVYASSSNPVISNSSITGNTTAGVWNTSTTPVIDAHGNWWGAASGPTHTSNPGGTGSVISNNVLYSPWLTQEPGTSSITISDTKAQPASLNPEGDSVLFTATISEQANWTIVIADSNNNPIRNITGTGTSVNVRWYGEDDASQKVADGSYYYWIEAVSTATGAQASSAQGLLMVSRQLPIAIFDLPADNQMYSGGTVISITGTASDSVDFKSYTLQYGAGENPASWIAIKNATAPVTNGSLHSWDTAALTGGIYTLKLTVTDNANNTAVETARVRLLWIQNTAVTETNLSPNNDGIKETTTVSSTFTYQSNWTITIKNSSNATVRTYTGIGTSLSQSWDGKDSGGTVVPDGAYTYQMDATSTETTIAAAPKTGTLTADTTSPVAIITAPTLNSTIWNTVQIIGTASDMNFDTYKVEYSPAPGTGPWTALTTSSSAVTNNTLATWITNDETNAVLLANGGYTLRLTVNDKAGNSSSASVPVTLENLLLWGVSAGSHALDTAAAQTITIFYTISSAANVTLKIIPETQGPAGTPVYQTSQAMTAAGTSAFTWDGKNNSGMTVPDEAYLYILEASSGTQTDTYSPPAPTGTSSVTCSQDTYNPYKNDPLTISYTVSQPSRVDLTISLGVSSFKAAEGIPHVPGNYTFDWNGRNPAEKILDSGAQASCAVAGLLPENHIITTGDTPRIAGLSTDPYELSLSYGQFTRITYDLSMAAFVTIKLISPSQETITLIDNESQSIGHHELLWNGRNSEDPTGKALLTTEQGAYIVSVKATNPAMGSSSTKKGYLKISQ